VATAFRALFLRRGRGDLHGAVVCGVGMPSFLSGLEALGNLQFEVGHGSGLGYPRPLGRSSSQDARSLITWYPAVALDLDHIVRWISLSYGGRYVAYYR